MAEKPISTPLPADLPTNWQTGQTVSPTGTEVGLTQQHGYNYQAQQINNAQTAINTINDAFENVYGDGDTVPVADGGTGAKTPQEALVNLGAASNPNLLDNWYFVGGGSQQGGGQFPINQRGQTSYTGGIYGFDRWQVTGGGQVQISDNGVIVTGISTYGGFQEYIENWGNFKGETVTLSFLISGGTAIGNGAYVDILTGESEYAKNVTEAGVASLTVSLPQDITKLLCALITSSNSGYDLTVIAAKLELGPVQTLAHQDAEGNWVLNDPPPNFQQELAKCQRYQKRYFYLYTGIGSGFAQSESQAVVLVNNVFMRDERPSISFSGLGLVSSNHSGTNAISVSNITPANAMGGMAVIVNTDGGLTKGESLILQIRENDGFFMFDANL